MKKILLSLLTVAVVVGAGVLATRAFFSDTEKSTGNLLQAGAIDLKVDNTSYYNGEVSTETSWDLRDLTIEKFFNFLDLKPGDWGEDTISLHVNSNPAYVCADVKLTSNDDNGLTDPEMDVDTTDGTGSGELAARVNWLWWADDGDNVLEENETPLPGGKLADLGVGKTYTAALADSTANLWTGVAGPIDSKDPNGADKVYYLGKAWCFGALTPEPLPQDEDGVDSHRTPANSTGGVKCDGVNEGNETQTDSLTADVSFTAVQARNNEKFVCIPPKPITRIDRTQLGFGDGGWAGWSCPAGTTAIGGGIVSSTNAVGGHGVAAPGAPAVDTKNYPIYPHYTYGTGETGYVVHDLPGDGLGNTISFYVECQAN